MFIVCKIITFELFPGVSLNYDNDTCDRPSTSQKLVLRFQVPLRDRTHNSICLILMKHWHKSAAVQNSALFWTP